jgi:hypothetical protein
VVSARIKLLLKKGATMAHSPVLVSESKGTRYAICKNCDSNIESWFFDREVDRLEHWSPFGVYVTFENGSGYLDKNCLSAPAIKTQTRKLVSV